MTTKHIWIILFSCFVVRSCGSSQGGSKCEVQVQVHRGTVYFTSPREQVEVKCPVQHCGQAVHIVWCKVLDTDICKKLNNSEHIQIIETMQLENKLESVLRFKRISTQDSGVYLCKEVKYGSVGHLINVTVSGTKQEDQKNDENSDSPENGPVDQNNLNEDEMKMGVYAYFVIFVSVVLLLLTITVIVLLRIHSRGLSQHQPPKTQEEQMPSRMIPGLPKRSPPPVLQQSLSSAGIVPPPPVPQKTTKDQPQASSTASSSVSAVYSEINRTKSGRSLHINSPGISQMNDISVVDNSESVVEIKI